MESKRHHLPGSYLVQEIAVSYSLNIFLQGQHNTDHALMRIKQHKGCPSHLFEFVGKSAAGDALTDLFLVPNWDIQEPGATGASVSSCHGYIMSLVWFQNGMINCHVSASHHKCKCTSYISPCKMQGKFTVQRSS